MISKHQLLLLASPVQVGSSKIVFPTAITLMATDHHNSNLPDAGVIFNPLVLEGLTSDDVAKYVGFGTSLSVATELKTYYPRGATPNAMDVQSLTIAQTVVDDVARSPIQQFVGGLVNTPVDFWTSSRSTRTTFTSSQSDALRRTGISDLELAETDGVLGPWCALHTLVLKFTTQLPYGFPGTSPADQALNPWEQSGTIKMAQTSLAASLSPILHILNAEGKVLSIPALLICDVHFGSPFFNSMVDLPLQHPFQAHLSLSFSLSADWRDAIVIGVSHNADVQAAISSTSVFLACAGGRPQLMTNRTIPCSDISLEIPEGQMKSSDRFSIRPITRETGSEITVGFPVTSTPPPSEV